MCVYMCVCLSVSMSDYALQRCIYVCVWDRHVCLCDVYTWHYVQLLVETVICISLLHSLHILLMSNETETVFTGVIFPSHSRLCIRHVESLWIVLSVGCSGLCGQYLTNDWLERLLWESSSELMRLSPLRLGWKCYAVCTITCCHP